MPKVGDRVIIESRKIGENRREGTLIGTVGPLINVRWADGSVSLFKPGAGSVTYEAANGATKAARVASKTPAKKALGTSTRKAPNRTQGRASSKAQPTKGKTAGKSASGAKKTSSSRTVTKKKR